MSECGSKEEEEAEVGEMKTAQRSNTCMCPHLHLDFSVQGVSFSDLSFFRLLPVRLSALFTAFHVVAGRFACSVYP